MKSKNDFEGYYCHDCNKYVAFNEYAYHSADHMLSNVKIILNIKEPPQITSISKQEEILELQAQIKQKEQRIRELELIIEAHRRSKSYK
ncbi:MAG: hypothetical protein A2V66_15490 [Ignavibacteria bacterium RBG_13_36_8]|nr:MAG: hypothetical protein A2V66_15490 [Ignavibacteria bacterium RBG_13_36_8]